MERPPCKLFVLTAFLFVITIGVSSAQAAPKVVASILPIHSLVASVMDGVGKPTLLLKGNASPHTFSLKPSQARLLSEADAVFWVAHDIEAFLEKPMETLAKKGVSVELGGTKGLMLLKYREGGAWEEESHDDHKKGHDDKHAKHDGHDDHEKKHGDKHAKHDDHDDHKKDHDHKHEKHDGHDDHKKSMATNMPNMTTTTIIKKTMITNMKSMTATTITKSMATNMPNMTTTAITPDMHMANTTCIFG